MKSHDLDPAMEAAFRKLSDAADRLETVRLRTENTEIADLINEPLPVTDGFMSGLAAMPNSSAELKTYAARVDSGECQWSEIELRASPVPPEVAELKESPNFVWLWTTPTSPPKPTIEYDVSPADWPDEFDDYPTKKSWLE